MGALDSLVIGGVIELLGGPGGTVSTNPACPGAKFQLVSGYDMSAPQPTSDYVGSLILDGERPYGRRASDRTITLPIRITAPDFTTLAAARELLMQVIDAQAWTLKWTRDATSAFSGGLGTALPLLLDCFRAQPSVPLWGGPDGYNRTPVAMITLTFQALPYGHSDALTQLLVASPIPGGSSPSAPVVLDTFSSVSGSGFSQSSAHIVGPHSAMWTASGPTNAPNYLNSFTAKNLTGLTALSVWVGVGANFPQTFSNPCTIYFQLVDSTSRLLTFSVQRTLTPSANASVPNWKLITAAIPQGRAFTYSQVTGYFISVFNTPDDWFGYNTWYDHLTAYGQSIQVAGARGSVYNLLGAGGTARTPLIVQAQQPGGAQTITFDTPGPFEWTAPLDAASTAAVSAIAGGGAGESLLAAGEGGGGGGGESATEAALGITPGTTYAGFVGAGGTPQTGISTLAITTASLPSGTNGTAYTAALAASGGTPAYTWSITVGTLQTGLSLNSSTGVISGTPSATSTVTLTIKVTDSLGATATAVMTLRVVAATTLAITTTSAPAGSVGGAYSYQLAATGGTTPYAWSVSAGTLPPGLAISATTGKITGIPTTIGTSSFTVEVADSASHTDTQALTIVVSGVTSSSLPLVGFNNGQGAFGGAAGGAFAAIASENAAAIAGQSFGYRGYGGTGGGSGPGGFPTTWDQGCVPPAAANFSVNSWSPVIATVLAGTADAAINQWAASCQAQWNKSPGSIFVVLWHEGDRSQTAAAFKALHAYVYPKFKAIAPDVPYGQITTEFNTLSSPTSWVSCPSTTPGGSVLDFYALDGYTDVSNTDGSATGYRDPVAVWGPAFAGILALVPNAVIGIGEANCETYAQRPAWFAKAWTLFAGTAGVVYNSVTYGPYNCLFFMSFFSGANSGDVITYNTDDSPAPGTNAAITTIIGEGAPAGTVSPLLDPPAVNGGPSSFAGDSATVLANGGVSATSITGAAAGTGSTNTTHHNGGAGAAGSTGSGSTPGVPYAVCTTHAAAASAKTVTLAVATSTTGGDALVVIAANNTSGAATGVTDTKGNTWAQVGSGANGSINGAVFAAIAGPGGSGPTLRLVAGTDTITVTYPLSSGVQYIIVRGCSGVSGVNAADVSIDATGTSTAPSSGSSGVLAQASEYAIAALINGNSGGVPSSWTGGFTALAGGSAHVTSDPYLTVAEQTTSATTALTAGATVVSVIWVMLLVTLEFAATGASYGGGAGSSAGLLGAGVAGSAAIGGAGPDIGGDGGDGSLNSATLPQAGQAPGGGGGGAASAGAAVLGGEGAPGMVQITWTAASSGIPFSSLILHSPGPDAPQALSPLVSFGSSPVLADGTVEYPGPASSPASTRCSTAPIRWSWSPRSC